MWLLTSDMRNFSQSLIAVATFVSNIFFWRRTGYWDTAAALKPLLHTWSLAVEEQYYILFPLFILLMWRWRKRWILGSLILVAGISLALAQWGAYHKPEANFFLLPTRAWEVAIGAILAFYLLYRGENGSALVSNRAVNEGLGLLGLVMIGYAIYTFDESVPYPSLYTLIPTLGSALIILCASPTTFVGRLLGARVLAGAGLISYSLYLWHQPLFAFARHRSLTQPSMLLLATLTILLFPLAYLSWRYVEMPFRNNARVSRKAIFSFAMIGAMAFITIGLAGEFTDGFAGRSSKNGEKATELVEKVAINRGLSNACEGSSTFSAECRTSDEPEILVWGDSFAMHLVDGIVASKPDVKLIQLTQSSCGPFFDIAPVIAKYPVNAATACLELTRRVHAWLQTNKTVKYAVLSSPFTQYLKQDSMLLYRNQALVTSNVDLVTQEFERTLVELETLGITPVVFSPPPANGTDLGHCLVRAQWLGVNLDECNFDRSESLSAGSAVQTFLHRIQKNHRVIWLENLICDSSRCVTHFGSIFVFRDSAHLSHAGSAALGQMKNFYHIIVAN
jgi:peptidoglycan/LPS O-acetylase OafA/YrhL